MTNNMISKLNINEMENKPYVVGVAKKETLAKVGVTITDEVDIVLWGDRLTHIEKHKEEFASEEEYKRHIESIPDIIQSPDYIGLHPNGESLEYIKKIDELVLVAVRIKFKGRLAVRTAYPITEEKLQAFLAKGRVKEINE